MNLRQLGLLVLLGTIWGASFLFIKVAVATVPPFTIVLAREGEMIGLTDRIRLRPLTAATRGNRLYLSSEEAPIRLISPQLDTVWTPLGGEPVVGRLGEPLQTPHVTTAIQVPAPVSFSISWMRSRRLDSSVMGSSL